MAWLSGWGKRIKLDIGDYTNDIGASVTWFPVTVFLTATQGEEVFVELTTDAEFLKVAFTKADGETELYGECELFDVSEELGIYHVSRDGWVINANTSIYMYYDADHADNNTYIGAITARTEVWDGDYKLVYHMVDDNGNVDDSTSNNNDGTKKGANEPIEATGKVGQGQNFDGDDHIDCGDNVSLDITGSLTLEACVKINTTGANHYFLNRDDGTNRNYILSIDTNQKLLFTIFVDNGTIKGSTSATALDTGTYYYAAGVYEFDSDVQSFVNGLPDGDSVAATGAMDNDDVSLTIGSREDGMDRFLNGGLDEIRISNTNRSDAWIKGTYNSLWDSLLTYGSEETFTLTATIAIATSITSALSRGITASLTATPIITTSITSSLSRGITVALTATSAITSSLTASLSRGITQALIATVAITSSITGSLLRGITQALTSTISITTSISGRLRYSFWEGIKKSVTYTEPQKTKPTYNEPSKGTVDYTEPSKK